MAEEIFTEPDDTHEGWVDVRMTDPEKGEWDVDVVVVNSRVEYVDLRVKPNLLTAFVDCLVDDVGTERASSVLSEVADRHDIDFSAEHAEE